MPTDAQIRANRENAQSSTGPSTPEGKAIVSRNRLSHGLRAAKRVLSFEDQQEYDEFRKALAESYMPSNPAEQTLFDDLVESCWRMRRSISVLDALTDNRIRETMEYNEEHNKLQELPAILGDTFEDFESRASMDYLSRLEGRYRNAWYKAQTRLAALKSSTGQTTRSKEVDPKLGLNAPNA